MKKILLLVCLITILLVFGCTTEKTTKEKSKTTTAPAISGAADKASTPKVMEKKTTPTVVPSDVTPTIITSDDTTETKSTSVETKSTASSVVAAGTIEIMGKQGFNPKKTTIKKGESITFVNKNPSELDRSRNSVLVFQNKKTGATVNSKDQIPYNKQYPHTFDEAGEYKFWDVGYGVIGAIVVE